MKKATIEELKNLTPGSVVLVDLDEHIQDFAIFKVYDNITNTAVVIDCTTLVSVGETRYIKNYSEYKDVFIVDTLDMIKDW